MIRMSTLGALLVALCAVLAAGASAAAPAPTAPIGDKCSTLVPDSLLASFLPEIYGRPTKLKYGDVRTQSWIEKKKETWGIKDQATGKVNPYTAPISFRHTTPSASACYWGSINSVELFIWYAPHPGPRESYQTETSPGGPYPDQAWATYSAGTNSRLRSQTDVAYWCSGGAPLEGFDSRDCAMQAVSGIGDRAAEGLGSIVFQEKGNTYMIKGIATDVQCLGPGANPTLCPAGSAAPILSYDTLEALAHKVADEVATSPPPLVKVTCLAAPYQCGPKPYS